MPPLILGTCLHALPLAHQKDSRAQQQAPNEASRASIPSSKGGKHQGGSGGTGYPQNKSWRYRTGTAGWNPNRFWPSMATWAQKEAAGGWELPQALPALGVLRPLTVVGASPIVANVPQN